MLLPKQQERIVSDPARFKIIRAGRRGGKTILEVEDMTFTAVSEKDSPVIYVAPTQTQARSIIWESLKSRLAGIGQPNEQRLEMKTPTQDGGTSLISIAGWENRENFRGRKAKKIYFDEVDTMKDFFIGWQEIFRPALMDYRGHAWFSGTPKKENPNLRRLEKEAETDAAWRAFHYTTADNPFIDPDEIEIARNSMDSDTFRQEILAEYIDDLGALFRYEALVDLFTNTIDKTPEKYLIVDIADDGSDKTVFAYWEGLDMYKVEVFRTLNTEQIIDKIREIAAVERIPYTNIAVDAIGVGTGVATSSRLNGIIGYKSSYGAIKTDRSPVVLPYVHTRKDKVYTTDYKNLRVQCVYTLADLANAHKVRVSVEDEKVKSAIIDELSLYQEIAGTDSKRFVTTKEDVKELLGHSPDITDTLIMRMYFVIKEQMVQSDEGALRVKEFYKQHRNLRRGELAKNSAR